MALTTSPTSLARVALAHNRALASSVPFTPAMVRADPTLARDAAFLVQHAAAELPFRALRAKLLAGRALTPADIAFTLNTFRARSPSQETSFPG